MWEINGRKGKSELQGLNISFVSFVTVHFFQLWALEEVLSQSFLFQLIAKADSGNTSGNS